MADPFVAEIRIFPFNFAPRGWAFCDGQLLPLSQNTALFSLLGTIYGGDGKTTFALPDLQGSAAITPGAGAWPILPVLGEASRYTNCYFVGNRNAFSYPCCKCKSSGWHCQPDRFCMGYFQCSQSSGQFLCTGSGPTC